jgi:predicted phage tail protein
VQITGTASDIASGGGGGVTVSIRKGTTVLWQQPLANGNTTGVTFNVTTTLAAGDALDFVINRGADGNNAYDSTAFDPTITFSSTTTTSTTSTTPPPSTGTATVSLSWNRNTESDLAYYRVHYGTSSRSYSNSIGVGTTTSSTISGLTPGAIYYFALTAVDTSGNQSSYSQEVAISR